MIGTLELCICCTVWNANRDASGCTTECDHPAGGAMAAVPDDTLACVQVLEWADWETDPDAEHTYAEPYFSTRPCDGCGSTLSGDRITHDYTDLDITTDN